MGLGMRSRTSLNAMKWSIQLYQAASAVMADELNKFLKKEGEQEELSQFLAEMVADMGNQPFDMNNLLDSMRASVDFIDAEINESYENYREYTNYRPPVAVSVPSDGRPHSYAIERGGSLVVVGKPDGMQEFMSSVEALMLEKDDYQRILHFSKDSSIPQGGPKPGTTLRVMRRPPNTWVGMANTPASCRRKVESFVQFLDDNAVDIIMVDAADIAYMKPIMSVHEHTLRSVSAVKQLMEVASKQTAVLVIGIVIPEMMPQEDREACIKIIHEQLTDSTIVYKD